MIITSANRYKKIPIQEVWAKGAHDDGRFRPSYVPEFTTPDKFIEAKVAMLRDDFYIDLTYEDIAHLRSFKTEGEINAAVKTIINKHLGG